MVNRNNLVISPLNTVMRRFEDNNSFLKDEIDGIYIKVTPTTDSIDTSGVVTTLASRSTYLSELVANANAFTRAIGDENQSFSQALNVLPQPTIAIVEGSAVGGG